MRNFIRFFYAVCFKDKDPFFIGIAIFILFLSGYAVDNFGVNNRYIRGEIVTTRSGSHWHSFRVYMNAEVSTKHGQLTCKLTNKEYKTMDEGDVVEVSVRSGRLTWITYCEGIRKIGRWE